MKRASNAVPAVRFLAVLLTAFGTEAQETTVYHGFYLVDPIARSVTADAFIVIEGEHIAEVGSGTAPANDDWRYIDLTGRYALPGFIDAHAHISMGPMTVEIVDGAPVISVQPRDELTRYHALEALASGVTTVRNPAGDTEANAAYDEKVATGEWLGPDAMHAGLYFEPTPIMHGSVHPEDEAGWEREILRQKALGMRYIKLYSGLSEAELETGIRLAHAHGLETIAHLDQVSWMRALDLGIDALTHALPTSPALLEEPHRSRYEASRLSPSGKFMYQWFELVDYNSAPIRALIEKLVVTEVPVDLTLAVHELVYQFDEIDRLYPPAERGFMHPEMVEPWLQQLGVSHFDWTAEDYTRAHAVMPKALELARRFHDAGVRLLLGTDGLGGSPVYLHELALHVRAGIDVWDVLALATTLNAERMGIGDRTGAIRAGFDADIVFLGADPTIDIGNAADVVMVVADGQVHRPEELRQRQADLIR